jgi:hypothetical protein
MGMKVQEPVLNIQLRYDPAKRIPGRRCVSANETVAAISFPMLLIYCAECGEISHRCECPGGVKKEDQKLLMSLPWERERVNTQHDYRNRNCPFFRLHMMGISPSQ